MTNEAEKEVKPGILSHVGVDEMIPNPQNPRMLFDPKPLDLLKRSIEDAGILNPLLVYKREKDGKIIILDGERRWRQYRKCHAVCGVKTNIITSVDITEGYVNDQTQFIPLANDTARNFEIRDFCADKGYLSSKHFELIQNLGGQAFIPFKKNTSGKCSDNSRSYFKSAFKYFKANREEYMNRYHKRSNIESTFSMIKRRFGNNVKCKKEISQDNEILAKILAHNICVLIQEIFLNKITLDFNFCAKHYVARN